MAGPWVSLFSGGKDSSWALYRALATGRAVETLVTVHPPADSFFYHVPMTRLADLAAESIGLPLESVDVDGGLPADLDSAERGDRELAPLEAALRAYRSTHRLAGVTAGAVASAYQADRLAAMCDRLDCELYTPLWGADPVGSAREMVDAGFDIRIVAVAADGLDEGWLGRQLDHEALDDLARLNEAHGVHVLGEGGEYETLVVDGPHMRRRIGFEAASEWDGVRGELRIVDAWFEP